MKEDFETIFYKVLKRNISIEYFEDWIYSNDFLELALTKEEYFDLISIDFKDKFALSEINNVIGHYVDFGKFEQKRINEYLKSIINRDNNCSKSIFMTYELYCKGFNFLRKIGLKYGLTVACPPAGNYTKSFEEISKEEQNDLINKFYPLIIEEAKTVLSWLESGKIKIKNEVDEFGYFVYIDNRTYNEKLKSEF